MPRCKYFNLTVFFYLSRSQPSGDVSIYEETGTAAARKEFYLFGLFVGMASAVVYSIEQLIQCLRLNREYIGRQLQ